MVELNRFQLQFLVKNPKFLLERAGAFAVFASQRHFETQSFDGQAWPARYPGQAPPILNIGGALKDFTEGRKTLPSRRFKDRPVLKDTGDLANRIAVQVLTDDKIELGNNLSYAANHQYGLESSQPITSMTKEGIRNFIEESPEYGKKLRPFLKKDEHKQRIQKRPFLGLDSIDKVELIANLERSLQVEIKSGTTNSA